MRNFGLARVQPAQALERGIDGKHVRRRRRTAGHLVIQFDPAQFAATLVPAAFARPVDQHVAHHPRRQREEMAAIADREPLAIHQPEVGLVHQRGGAQRVAGLFAHRLPVRQHAKLAVERREQGIERRLVAVPPGYEQAGHVIRRISACVHGVRRVPCVVPEAGIMPCDR